MKKIIAIIFLIYFVLGCEPREEVANTYIPPETSVSDKQFNFHIVDDDIWRSAQPSIESIAVMKRHGLKTIINLRGSEENQLWESRICDSLGIQYFHISMDGRDVPDTAHLNNILRIIENQQNQPVMYHCLGGKDRTGIVTAIYRLKNSDISFEEVHKEMLMYGYNEEEFPHLTEFAKTWREKYLQNAMIDEQE
jgi:protein tyrosine/serine phosphatase